jgi:HAD superfamily hydrolase (TIGR01509 family)
MTSHNKYEYDVVILDMDGTILDSRGEGEIKYEWAYEACKKSLRRYEIELSIEEIDKFFLHPLYSEGEEGVVRFCDKLGLDSEEFWSRREKDVIEAKIEAMKRGEIKLYDASLPVIKSLGDKVYLAVVSDSQQECVDFTLEHFRLKKYFKVWYGRRSELKELASRKPNPVYINRVLNELNTGNDDAILVDDSPVGILAARNAGIDSVFLNKEEEGESEGDREEKEMKMKFEATFVIRDIGELVEIL